MERETIKYLTKGELEVANRLALKAKCNAIDPAYVEQLPSDMRYPVFFAMPWERPGWVRCQIGTATAIPADDYVPLLLDVPNSMYDKLGTVEVVVDDELAEMK